MGKFHQKKNYISHVLVKDKNDDQKVDLYVFFSGRYLEIRPIYVTHISHTGIFAHDTLK